MAVLFLGYSVLTWNISATYTDSAHNRKQLQLAELLITKQNENDELRGDISKMLADKNDKQQEILRAAYKDVLNEIATNPVYQSCRNSDRVRNAIGRKLSSQ